MQNNSIKLPNRYKCIGFTNLGLVYQQGKGINSMADQIPFDQDPDPGRDTYFQRSGSDSDTISKNMMLILITKLFKPSRCVRENASASGHSNFV